MEDEQQSPGRLGTMVGMIAGGIVIALGLVGFVPLCGCITGPLSWAAPAGAGLVAGAMAVSSADWSEADPGQETSHGVGLAVRAGAVSAAIAAVAFLLMSLLAPVVGVAFNVVLNGTGENLVEVIMASLMVAVIGLVINVIIAIGSAVLGVGLAAAAGAISASSANNASQ
ncbi:MAG: hypothetical protein KTR31_37710 [Myxococcales bacterium]|nr:hypothetical protein [Myxococcales bacterium]